MVAGATDALSAFPGLYWHMTCLDAEQSFVSIAPDSFILKQASSSSAFIEPRKLWGALAIGVQSSQVSPVEERQADLQA